MPFGRPPLMVTRMINRVKFITLLFVAVLSLQLVEAQQRISLKELRDNIAKVGEEVLIEQDIAIEGYIISNPQDRNNELNITKNHQKLSIGRDVGTGYLEAFDGSVGLRMFYTAPNVAKYFPQYASVVLSLRGVKVEKTSPYCITLHGIDKGNILKITRGSASDIPVKRLSIPDIKAEDVYTYVTLTDCEFVVKDGAYTNVYETYMLRTEVNAAARPNNSIDCWARLLHDKEGNEIYALVNMGCLWRRGGEGVPQGAGEMRGVLVPTRLPRYGVNAFGEGLVVRPMESGDFAMEWSERESNFKTLVEWNWNDNGKLFKTESGDKSTLTYERVKADVGVGTLRSMVSGAKVVRGRDTNNTIVTDGKEEGTLGERGLVRRGAFSIRAEAHCWWDWKRDCGKGVELEFSTKGVEGKNLLLAFTFAAGNIRAANSYGHPVFWGVEYSLDGENFTRVERRDIELRTLPWWWINNVNGVNYESAVTGAGVTEHLIRLPAELFNKERVVLRVVPIRKNAATLGYDCSTNGALRPNLMVQTNVNFGAFIVRYN